MVFRSLKERSDLKEIGRTGEKVSAIGLGTWDIRDYSKAEEALIYAVELGLNLIDTAEMYDAGRAEELVGQVARRVGKDRVFITTKLLPDHFKSRDDAIKAARASLRRLGLEIVDLILIHWPLRYLPIEFQVKNLEAIAEAGLTRYIGVSNFTVKELKAALESTKKHSIVVNQVKYSVLDREVEKELLPFCVSEGITVQAYTPLERGLVAKNQTLAEIGRKYNRTPVQVALNYLILHERVVAIPKTEKKPRVKEFKEAMGWRLRPEDVAVLKGL
uniref:Aldo/keto reductase n=1 Tax=Fervidicoccus fontis TaxID=683846 RepID=A0A7J3ZJQ6_9CREN